MRICYTFSVFGNDAPLFAVAPPCGPCAHEGDGIPRPLTRAALQDDLRAATSHYYGAGKSIAIYAPDWPRRHAPQPVPASAIVVADLSGWPTVRRAITSRSIRARTHAFPAAQSPRQGVRVDYRYGFSAAIGGGEYVRPQVEPSLEDKARFDAHDFATRPPCWNACAITEPVTRP